MQLCKQLLTQQLTSWTTLMMLMTTSPNNDDHWQGTHPSESTRYPDGAKV
jgi:hypothetical protein